MKLSDAGLAAIKRFEGRSLTAYRDVAQVWTIGYGTTRYRNGDCVRPGDTITAEEAEALLRDQLEDYAESVRLLVKVPLSQQQFDALVSWTYNLGAGALRDSTMLKRLNAGDYAGAADEMLRWVNAGGRPVDGLRRRREAERQMFLSGTADADRPVALVSAWADSGNSAGSSAYVTALDERKEPKMTREIVLALVRHLLTSVGAVLVARGVADAGTVEAIAGGVLAVVGLALSYRDKVARVPA